MGLLMLRLQIKYEGENVACCFLVLVITHLNKQCCEHLPLRSQDRRLSGDFFPVLSPCSVFLGEYQRFYQDITRLFSTPHPR